MEAIDDFFPCADVTVLDAAGFWKEFFEIVIPSDIRKLVRKWPHEKVLTISYPDVVAFGKNGITNAEQLIENPVKTLEQIQDAITNFKLVQKKGEILPVTIRIVKLEKKTDVRDLRGSEHVGSYVSVEGLIRKAAPRKERLTVGVFKCNNGHRTIKAQPYAMKDIPVHCSAEGCRLKPIELVDRLSTFKDSQKALLQEHIEHISPGSQPESIEIELDADLINSIYAGNRVIVNGILKRYQTSSSKTSTTYKNYIDVNSVEVTDKEYSEIEITIEDEDKIQELAADPAIYERLTRSVVPTVYGLENVKRAFIYAFFGGSTTESSNGVQTRGNINILLIGEPGIAKTDMLRKLVKYSPRGVYTSGKGSSGVGLVAAVIKDDFGDGSYSLEAGAMAQADGGICVFDEFGQLDETTISLLYEGIESQQVTIHKANIHATIPTRCSVIAAANPKDGWIDDFTPLKDQIGFPGPLMQRFDLIYILRDKVNLERDEQIIRHIIGVRSGNSSSDKYAPDIEPDLLRKYIAFSKQQGVIRWTKSAEDSVVEYYLNIRKTRKDTNSAVPITPRQGNSLARLSEASARIRLSKKVESEDVDRAVRILDECLREVAYDPNTGSFDIGNAATGKNKKLVDLERDIKSAIRDLADDQGRAKTDSVILKLAGSHGGKEAVEKGIETLYKKEEIRRPNNSTLKVN
ncbi:MAG TPA: minichromosome maintenance protein MCM [Methanospirillum sp.]|nr:minichromosome maintenance protein MCM [Methanospirillum sp.]